MSVLPVIPHLKRYKGSKESLRLETYEFNQKAHRIADHLNRLIANNPNDIQQYSFQLIAFDLGLSVDDVRNAISDGGYNGITIGVTQRDRLNLMHFKNS